MNPPHWLGQVGQVGQVGRIGRSVWLAKWVTSYYKIAELQGKALALAELGNVLMMPGRARDQDQWLRDAKLLSEAGAAAFKAAQAKDVEAIVALNDQLVASCTSCHMHYRPADGRRRQQPQSPPQQHAVPPQ